MFADHFKVKFGDDEIIGTRLSIKEIKKLSAGYESMSVNESLDVIRNHCKLANGEKIDPEDLTHGQIQTLLAELILPKEGRSLSDFIGLLC